MALKILSLKRQNSYIDPCIEGKVTVMDTDIYETLLLISVQP